MIAKISKGSGFRGLLDYLLKNGRGEIVGGNLAGSNARELSKEFGAFRRLRPSLGKAVAHISLSAHPEDRKIEDEEWEKIADKVAMGLGFYECSRVVIKHTDTEHQHVHLVFCRVDRNGQTVTDSNDYRKIENLMRRIEIDHELRRVEKKKTKEVDTMTPAPKPAQEFLTFKTLDEITDKEDKNERSEARTEGRRGRLKEVWGESFEESTNKSGPVRYTFTNGGKVEDQGRTVKATRGTNAVQRLLAIAKAKGWVKVFVSGPKDMVKKAFEMAKQAGLIVYSELSITNEPNQEEGEDLAQKLTDPPPILDATKMEERDQVSELNETPKLINLKAWRDNRSKGTEEHDKEPAEKRLFRPR